MVLLLSVLKQYTEIFSDAKIENFIGKKNDICNIVAQNINCGYALHSTYNLCFGAKIRKYVYPFIPQFYYIKVGYKGVYIIRTCYRDVNADLFYVW